MPATLQEKSEIVLICFYSGIKNNKYTLHAGYLLFPGSRFGVGRPTPCEEAGLSPVQFSPSRFIPPCVFGAGIARFHPASRFIAILPVRRRRHPCSTNLQRCRPINKFIRLLIKCRLPCLSMGLGIRLLGSACCNVAGSGLGFRPVL